MTLRISGKHMDVGDALRTRIEDRIGDAVEKYFGHGFSGQVTMEKQGSFFLADCMLHLDSGINLQASAREPDPHASFDKAAERIEKRLRRYKRSRVDGAYLSFATISDLSQKIAAMSHQERARVPCIGRQRADLVVAGCAILEAICQTWPVGWLRVADRGLREGILFNMMGPCVAEKPRWAPNPRAAAKPRLAATPSAIAGSCSPCMAGDCGAAG